VISACFICQRPVLELHGQYMWFAAWMLGPGDEALEENALGSVHCSCLSLSAWGAFWSFRLRRYWLEQRGYRLARWREPYHVLLPPPGAPAAHWHPVVVQDDGVAFVIESLKDHRGVKDGLFLPHQERIENLKLEAELLEPLLRFKPEIPLLEIYRALGVLDTVCHPQALEAAVLKTSASVRKLLSLGALRGDLHYAQFVPNAVLNLLEEAITHDAAL
jgi:hypothetical protein